MFFFKKEESGPKRIVAVLGTSPLAIFLTYVLQQNNVYFLYILPVIKNVPIFVWFYPKILCRTP